MTKIESIIKLMKDYNGLITWEIIYKEIEKYYPNAKKSTEWKAGLRGVLLRELDKKIKRIDSSTYALIDYDIRKLLPFEPDESIISEKEVYTKVRMLQTKFRKNLLLMLKICPITLIDDERLLVASHIKPWSIAIGKEKIDVNNGLLLSPLYDTLFDKGLITFSNKKELIVSSTVDIKTRMRLDIKECVVEKLPIKGREEYLEFHRSKIFIEA